MKKKRMTLSVKQMKHLESLGLDINDASMHYILYKDKEEPELACCSLSYTLACIVADGDEVVPAYTLQDIIEKIGWVYEYTFVVGIQSATLIDFDGNSIWHEEVDDDSLEASYKMLCWLIDNGHIQTNKKEEKKKYN